MRAWTGRERQARPTRGPPGTGRAGASRGRQGRGCGAWPGPGPRRVGSSAGWREPAGGALRHPAPRGSPGGLAPAPGPGPAAAPGRQGVRGNSSTVGPGSMGRSVQREGAVRPAADTLIHHSLQVGVQRRPWTGDRGAKGNRPRRPRVTCAHTCVQACSQETARVLCSTRSCARGAQPTGPGGALPAGAGRPGRPLGPAPAPVPRPGSRPGPAAALGCFWVSAPLRCLQGGRSSVSEKPSHPLHWDPAAQGQARPGPAAHRSSSRALPRALARDASLTGAPEAHEVENPLAGGGHGAEAARVAVRGYLAGRAGRL